MKIISVWNFELYSWEVISATSHLFSPDLSSSILVLLLSAPVRSNAVADYVLLLFIYFIIYFFFIHRSFSETTRPIITKFSGIVYSSVVWIVQ